MSGHETILLSLYFATLGLLAVYGCHRLYLLFLHRVHRLHPHRPAGRLDPLPRVTVQLPVYNERYVVERLIRAACAMEYPRDRLEIQVLDDSTDDTSVLAARLVERLRREGHDITHIRRGRRDGFKAGALAAGLRTARGELLAVFDADFVPGTRFLIDLVDHFSHPRVGLVQARWGHLNRDFSLLTRLQAILLDGHFVIEHAARSRAGRFFNFNGTAGIWRRTCIESAGGWQADTLTEDLDLSYRAQLAGWSFIFISEVVAPAELPAQMDAFKSQQHRWARGSIQTGRKILPRVLRSRLPFAVKAEALFHLTNNIAYPLMSILAVLIVPAMAIRRGAGLASVLLVDLPLFLLSTLSVGAYYVAAQRAIGHGWRQAVGCLPLVMSLGIGLCLNNARAVLGGLAGRRSEFVRTPKHSLEAGGGDWRGKRYRGHGHRAWTAVEMLCATYFTAASACALLGHMYAALPFLLLFQGGFLYTSFLSLVQARRRPPSPGT